LGASRFRPISCPAISSSSKLIFEQKRFYAKNFERTGERKQVKSNINDTNDPVNVDESGWRWSSTKRCTITWTYPSSSKSILEQKLFYAKSIERTGERKQIKSDVKYNRRLVDNGDSLWTWTRTWTRTWPVISSSSKSFFEQKRFYAKSFERTGERKQVKSNINDTSDLVDLGEVRAEMKREIEQLREDYVQQLSARPTLQSFERLVVKLPDNSEVPLNHLAQITFKNPQTAIINVAASPHAVRSVADALIKSGLCGNPQIQTTTIYVPLPKPSREYREQLVNNAKLLYNRCHDRLRSVDKKFQLKLRPFEKTAPKDTFKAAQVTLHALMKDYAHQAEQLMKEKQKELMEEIK